MRPALRLLNRRGDHVAVLGPASVVILNVVESEQILQDEPGVARALANAAIGDRVFLWIHAFLLNVNLLQLIGGFEGAVLIHSGAPGNALGSRDMSTTLGSFAHARRRDDLPGKLVRAAHID